MKPLTIHELWQRLQSNIEQAQRKLGIEEPIEAVVPPDAAMGHLGFPAFSFARQLRRSPQLIAEDIAANLAPDDLIAKVEVTKGYVNLFLDASAIARTVLPQIFEREERFAADGVKAPEKWVLEYSSPNTNKPLHLGHIRNNLLGMSVAEIASYFGHEVVKVNLVNDRGIHICKTMLAYQLWSDGKTPESTGSKGDHFVGDYYVRFDREFRQEHKALGGELSEEAWFNSRDSKLGSRARELLKSWEAGEEETLDLWRTMNRWVLDGFDVTYRRMGCSFERMQFESETYMRGKSLVEEGVAKGIFGRREDGAVILDLETIEMKGEKVLLRSDGTSVYMTQDLGTALIRIEQFSPQRLVYVVGDEQLYHFQVLFGVLSLLKPGTGERCIHLSYGMVRLPEGKMKSREGKVVDADDLMDALHALARAELEGRAADRRAHVEDMTATELDFRAERIAQAALKFFVMRYTPKKSFEYDPKKSIDFTGQTGPYCLYAYARTRSLIRKGGWKPVFDQSLVELLTEDSEQAIIRQLFFFPQVLQRATDGFDPSKIADYSYELASSFARMFTDKQSYPIVTCPDENLKRARLMLAHAVGTVLRAALGLIGISVLEEM